METLTQFKQRTQYVHSPMSCWPMVLNPNLSMKVNDEGHFRPFYGDTVVYLLKPEIKVQLSNYQKTLMEACGDLFAEPLIEDTFHLTLHDLNNSPNDVQIAEKMSSSQKQVQALMKNLRQDLSIIHLKSTKIFSMVNTSVVLCFEPETEEDCQKLMQYYDFFQKIVPLCYPLTPHITLAYYNAPYTSQDEYGNWIKGRIPAERMTHLKEVIDTLNKKEPIRLELSVFDLAYQHFTTMNHYQTKFQLKRTVLIASGNADARQTIKETLHNLNIDMNEAVSISDLIKHLDEHVNILVLDTELPNVDALELLNSIHQEFPNLSIIATSVSPFCKEKTIHAGAIAAISYPLSKEEFEKKFQSVIKSSYTQENL